MRTRSHFLSLLLVAFMIASAANDMTYRCGPDLVVSGEVSRSSTFGILHLAFGSIQDDKLETKPKITFLELGSVGCMPCKKMVPIMKSIEKKYGSQIKVIFHDVKKDKSKIDQYKVELIPTQVFLDENGKEVHRHVGYYPEKEIDAFLKKRGLKILS